MAAEFPAGMFFVRISRSAKLKPTSAEHFGDQLPEGAAGLSLLASDPDEEGWEWVDVWFDRAGAEDIARKYERSSITVMSEATDMQARDISGEVSTVAEVVSVPELLDQGGYDALGRAVAAV